MRRGRTGLMLALAAILLVTLAGRDGQVVTGAGTDVGTPKFSTALAFDVSGPLRAAKAPPRPLRLASAEGLVQIRPEHNRVSVKDTGFTGDGALRGGAARPRIGPLAPLPVLANFEGLSNLDNFNLFGFRVNPPDPMGDVGPNHYVEMINLALAVYDKSGTMLLGPLPIGALWDGFPVEDCTDPSGDPVVLHDQTEDRWILSQFTTRGPLYYNCVAVSQTPDPTGAYYRYAFSAGEFFPDYPKYGVWTNSYLLTSRDFGPTVEYGISVYALEKNKMIAGSPKARAVQFFLDSEVVPLHLIGDGLLPADLDGERRPRDGAPAPIVGTMDDGYAYGAPFDALNVFELSVQWKANPVASLRLATQLPVASFDSVFPCGPSRGCIPQPGITNPDQWLDVLSYRQRPTWRLAYRNFGKYEAMVTNQSVEARPGLAGVRWYEIRRSAGVFSLQQQGTYAPDDGVHRWMGSIAMDWQGNMSLGYSVSNGTDVYPGIRFTGRLAGDPLGEMTIDEGVIINGTGVQTTTNSRWGDYTSMNIDPADDCTFWYVNEYYAISGLPLPLPPPPLPPPGTTAPWQTRIGSFKMPGCTPKY